ncbi:hypothetical protein BX600DRAFT_514145 [Xylariales sp. PMI_506]|nr:hypothetical protein BX600DRAFT_514145 [Xylariales sp. PMI_506]
MGFPENLEDDDWIGYSIECFKRQYWHPRGYMYSKSNVKYAQETIQYLSHSFHKCWNKKPLRNDLRSTTDYNEATILDERFAPFWIIRRFVKVIGFGICLDVAFYPCNTMKTAEEKQIGDMAQKLVTLVPCLRTLSSRCITFLFGEMVTSSYETIKAIVGHLEPLEEDMRTYEFGALYLNTIYRGFCVRSNTSFANFTGPFTTWESIFSKDEILSHNGRGKIMSADIRIALELSELQRKSPDPPCLNVEQEASVAKSQDESSSKISNAAQIQLDDDTNVTDHDRTQQRTGAVPEPRHDSEASISAHGSGNLIRDRNQLSHGDAAVTSSSHLTSYRKIREDVDYIESWVAGTKSVVAGLEEEHAALIKAEREVEVASDALHRRRTEFLAKFQAELSSTEARGGKIDLPDMQGVATDNKRLADAEQDRERIRKRLKDSSSALLHSLAEDLSAVRAKVDK